MFELQQHTITHEVRNPSGSCGAERAALLVQQARDLYSTTRSSAILAWLWRTVSRRSFRLLDLAEVHASGIVRGRHSGGTQEVPLSQIRGSEGRTHDFDYAFRPLQTHTKQRWLSIAMAHYSNVLLPPITLTQVGEVYFVQDGHHRVSVARALGSAYIDAVVTIWDVVGVLPWEPTGACLTFQPA